MDSSDVVMSQQDFMSLNHKRQHLVMYETLVDTRRRAIYNQWKQRIIIGWLVGITAIGGWVAERIFIIGKV